MQTVTNNQAAIIDEVQALTLKIAGEVVAYFKAIVNPAGGFYIDVHCRDRTNFCITEISSLLHMAEDFASIPKASRSKANREVIQKVTNAIFNFRK